MSLALPNPFLLLHQTLDRMSPLDTTVLVLFTSFVSPLLNFQTLLRS